MMAGIQPASAATDTTAPVIVSSYVDKSSLDVSSAPATLTLSVRITDETAVEPYFSGRLVNYSTGQYVYFNTKNLTSGTAQNGVWRTSATLSPGAAAGKWAVELFGVQDTLGNQIGGYIPIRTITVTSAATDTTAPVIVSSYVDKSSLDVSSAPATLTLSVRITDETAVEPYFSGRLVNYSTGQYVYFNTKNLTSGTAQNGVWRTSATLSPGAAAGKWAVELFGVQDTLGNQIGGYIPIRTITVNSG